MARDHTNDPLRAILHSGEHGGVGSNAVTDEGAGGNDAFDSLSGRDLGTLVADKALKVPQIGRKGIISHRVPVHTNSSTGTVPTRQRSDSTDASAAWSYDWISGRGVMHVFTG